MEYEPAPLPLDLFAAGRALAYLATLALVGLSVFAALTPRWRAPKDDDRSLAARALARAWEFAAIAAILLITAHLVRAVGQVRSFLEPGEPLTWAASRPMLLESAWGHGWIVQFVAAVLAAVAGRFGAHRGVGGLALLGSAVLCVVGASPLTGHAGEHPWGPAFGIGLHALHLLGGGVWLGTLGGIVLAAIPIVHRGDPAGGPDLHTALGRLIRVFSPFALVGSGLAVGAGLLLGYAYVGDLHSLFTTAYGRALIIKGALVLTTMALGAWNWRRLTPQLGTATGSERLRRSAMIEAGVGALIIATTAVLVALPAPRI